MQILTSFVTSLSS